MKAENCAVTADIPTSDDDQKANANPLKPPTYQTAQAYTTDRPRPTAKRFGDFEMDLIVDAYGHAILVLLERMTGFVMMEKLPYGKRAKPLSKTVVRMLYAYRKYLKTITTDNGSEFAAHLDITAGLRIKGLDDVTVYFADSYCSWQKGAVENINKLIRQYIPKKSNFNDFTDLYIKNVAKKLNLRPRKNSVFQTRKPSSSNKSLILHLPVEPAWIYSLMRKCHLVSLKITTIICKQ